MTMPANCYRLGLVGTVALLLGPLASASQACLIPWTAGYGYSSYYAPTAGYGYTANYGGYGGGGCCLTNLFGCCGLFGHGGYSAAYAPTYQYAPSYCAPACDPCGGSCGTYGNCGACGTCGTTGYSLGGTWSGSCPSGDCGIPSTSTPSTSPSPYSGQPVTPPSSSPPSSAPPQTYREDGSDDGFRQPQPIPGTGGGGGGLFPPEDGAGSTSSGASGSDVAPAGGRTPDSDIERNDGGFQLDAFKIPARDRADEAADDDEADDAQEEDAAEESGVIEPLDIDAVATSVTPQRRRAHYRAIFRTPSVARSTVPSQSGWEAIGDVPSLANVDK